MARAFITPDFLLAGRSARRLYHGYAEGMPIYDYHCHLEVKDIAANRAFRSLAEAWLAGDHYKWRAMRAAGVEERLVSGDASEAEKLAAWARTVPSMIGNPLYHWTHLELARYFGVREQFSPATVDRIAAAADARLQQQDFHARGLLQSMDVRVICTTDDPADALEHHDALRADPSFPVTVVPAFRPDPALGVGSPGDFNRWIDRLSVAAGLAVREWPDLLQALRRRRDAFHERGCRLSDHGIETVFDDVDETAAVRVFRDARAGTPPIAEDCRRYASTLLVELGRMYAEKGWAWQMHLGALRNVNSRAMRRLGPNTGYDAIGDLRHARGLAGLLDRLDREDRLPKTILYSLNPVDNAVLVSLSGCFMDGRIPGKVQHGSAWWFNDQKQGIEDQLRTLASLGLLSRFVGMLTDSRSFLSFPRHEYFRRILCSLLGGWMDAGELPRDYGLVGGLVGDVCWNNAERFFGIPLKGAPTAT